ncbi:hypothetical protein [Spongiactinospora sp. TRM90649]|uniref:hypothetical protein n=1 Tax=Spongiactinospora sp. TRM90649 TaxID=3031114 RepID=UPI0023F84CC5|nr:hypothetical protein [Spongiactinospora sp. TRM90649]MDF5758333.1 hypothetical protein [Spongiactinospora sp. TRM90649]
MSAPLPQPHAPGTAVRSRGVPLLWVCGARAVGKSSVGWEIFMRLVRDGVTAAYVDLAQLGFVTPAPADDPGGHRLRARALGVVWAEYAAMGARRLILSGDAPGHGIVRLYIDAVPGAEPVVCRLRAAPDRLAERLLRRGRGEGPPLPGDDLLGLPAASLLRHVERSALDTGHADIAVDTSHLTVAQAADLVLAKGWPLSGDREP